MIALGNFLTSTTREHYFEKAVDNFYDGNEFYTRLRSGQRPWPGGHRIKITTDIKERETGGSYSAFDTFDVTQEDVRIQMYADPAQYYWNLTLNGIQLATNRGTEAYIDLMTAEFASVKRAMESKLGTDIYGDGTGNNNKALNGLVYQIDDATNVDSFQGQSRTTYAKLKSTRNTQGGALALSDLASDMAAAQIGRDNPTLILTTPAIFAIIEALLTFTYNVNVGQQYAMGNPTGFEKGVNVATGMNRITYRGVPILSDDKCTAANLWMLNENHMWLYTLEHNPELVSGTKEGFAWTGWKKSINQDAIVGQILFAGQIAGDSPRTMSRRENILT